MVVEVERHFSMADEVESSVDEGLKQAERLRQSILKKAFEGRLVPQDPSDEPAQELLQRIREEKPQLKPKTKTRARKKGRTQQMRLM